MAGSHHLGVRELAPALLRGGLPPRSQQRHGVSHRSHVFRSRQILMHRMNGIQLQIQLQHIHARLSEESPLPRLRMPRHKRPHIPFAHSPLARHARNLKFRSRRRNMWIQPRARTSNQIHRNTRPRVFRLQLLHVAIHARNQRRICRPQIGSSSTRRVRIVSGSPRGRRPRMKISRRSKRLPNQARSHHLPAQVNDFSIRLSRKSPLR
jgi:hypothetical protein